MGNNLPEKTTELVQAADRELVERGDALLKAYENDPTLAEVEQLLRASGHNLGPAVVVTPHWQYTLSCG